MSFQEELYYKIEAYLSGELDAGEMAAFESQISTDDSLRAEVAKHKVANALIVEQRLLSVKNIFQAEKIKDTNSTNPIKPLGFIALAVVAVGIGTSVWMMNKKDVSASSEKGGNTAAQIASATGKSENTTVVENTDGSIKEGSKYSTSEEIGFHKQQIQQIEGNLHADEKGVLHVDSSFVSKKIDVKPVTIPATVPAKSDNITTDVNPCTNVSIQATVRSTPSCSHDATGSIFVQNIQGGTKPYSISLSSINNDAATNGALEKGSYQALVTDGNGCIRNYSNIVVDEKDCPKDYSFNPFYGNEEWSIDPEDSERKLEIYDKGGVLYFQRTIPASASYKWTGMGIGNQIVPGYYIFVMKHADGTVQKGSVTIVQ